MAGAAVRMRGHDKKDDVSIFFADSTRQALQVLTCGCNSFTRATIPVAREWLAETATMYQLAGSCKKFKEQEVISLVIGFVADRAQGLRDLRERLQPAGTMQNLLAVQPASQFASLPACARVFD